MHILITGGTGLIGAAFIRHFEAYQFTVLSRSQSKAKRILPPSVTCIESLDKLQNIDDFDAVINLAGEPIVGKRWSQKQKHTICQSRWETTRQLVDLFAKSKHPPDVFLSGSAIGIYGDRGDESLSENISVQKHDFPTEVCMNWEAIARRAEPYTRVVLLRTGIVLASHGGALPKMLLPFKFCVGGPIGKGGQYMSWIHYLDHINALDYLLKEKSISGPVNLVAPEAQTNTGFTETLAKALHRPAIFPMPETILRLLLGESSCLLLDSQKVLPQKLIDSGFHFRYSSLQPALVDLVQNTPRKESL